MEIKTKFTVNDLIQHKFQKNVNKENRMVDAYEILEVVTQTCYAGTQVFYICRPLFKFYEKDYTLEKDKRNVLTDILHAEKMDIKFREDEIKIAPQDLIDFIKSTP